MHKTLAQIVVSTNSNLKMTTRLRDATHATRAPKPDKTPVTSVRHCFCRHILFFKIKVKQWSCRSYSIWRHIDSLKVCFIKTNTLYIDYHLYKICPFL